MQFQNPQFCSCSSNVWLWC